MFGGGDGEMKNDHIRRKPVGKHDFSDHDHGQTNLGKEFTALTAVAVRQG
jgi:hypothetical protein